MWNAEPLKRSGSRYVEFACVVTIFCKRVWSVPFGKCASSLMRKSIPTGGYDVESNSRSKQALNGRRTRSTRSMQPWLSVKATCST